MVKPDSSAPPAHMPPVVALTGSIGSGKSTLRRILGELGAITLSADELAREVVLPGTPGLHAVTERFAREAAKRGLALLLPDGSLNRMALAQIVFEDASQRQVLESILHPLIRTRFEQYLSQVCANHPLPRLIVYEIPLLFETNYPRKEFTHIVTVHAPEHVRIARIVARDRCGEHEARQKMQAQLSDEDKARRADIVIDNSGTEAELRQKAEELMQRLAPKTA